MSKGQHDPGAQHGSAAWLGAHAERYLAEVDAALLARGVQDRTEIVAGMREHLREATHGAMPGDGAALRDALRRMGDPQAIAEAAADDADPSGAQAVAPTADDHVVAPGSRWVESWVPSVALGLLLVGGLLVGLVLPVVLVIAGAVLLWGSALWTVQEKALASASTLAPGLALWFVLGFSGVEECSTQSTGVDVQTVCSSSGGGGAVMTAVVFVVAIAGVVGSGVLWQRGMGRAAAATA
jgi:hypothetical protein